VKHHIIYIPGLGDRNDGIRAFFLKYWQIFGVRTQLVPMQWNDGASYDEKYDDVVRAIKAAQAEGFRVSLVGESAGASMAMNVFAKDTSLHRIVSLSGVNSHRTPISPHLFAKSPAFEQSVSNLHQSQQRSVVDRKHQISSITALVDATVPVKVNKIKMVRSFRVPSIGHVPTILLCLSIYSFIIVYEAKRRV